MNILLIVFNQHIIDADVLRDRINAIGDTFYIYENIVFVETEYNVKEIYDKISYYRFEDTSILVLHIHNDMFGFWGRMNIELWDWLKEREDKTRDGLLINYIAEIQRQDAIIKQLKADNPSERNTN